MDCNRAAWLENGKRGPEGRSLPSESHARENKPRCRTRTAPDETEEDAREGGWLHTTRLPSGPLCLLKAVYAACTTCFQERRNEQSSFVRGCLATHRAPRAPAVYASGALAPGLRGELAANLPLPRRKFASIRTVERGTAGLCARCATSLLSPPGQIAASAKTCARLKAEEHLLSLSCPAAFVGATRGLLLLGARWMFRELETAETNCAATTTSPPHTSFSLSLSSRTTVRGRSRGGNR